MDGIAAEEVHVAQLHPDVDEQLFIASDIVIVTTLIHTDDVAIGYHAIFVFGQSPCRAEGGIEDERKRCIRVHFHRLIEESAGFYVGYDNREIVSPVPADELLMGGDRLIFAGQIDEMLELKRDYGFVSADHHVFTMDEVSKDRQLRTAYVTFGSDLIGSKIGDSTFEKDNNMVLVAVARMGKRIDMSPRKVTLQAGDTLLLECPPNANIHTRQAPLSDNRDHTHGHSPIVLPPCSFMVQNYQLLSETQNESLRKCQTCLW